ncbi:hypothetical protein HY469_05345 [Candidatus Roizmanbacteria bacterium]|nr:hypothetical protein [Candidatus Roizmanbacteria bacterium]
MTKREGVIFASLSVFLVAVFLITTAASRAQTREPSSSTMVRSSEEKLATASAPLASEAAALEELLKENITQPEQIEQKSEILEVFARRPANKPTLTNFFAYTVQSAVRAGVPANTIILILLLPFLATIAVLIRYVIGLPSLGILFPIALSITLLATGITVGAALLITILFATTTAQMLLRKIRIMHMPKLALSILMVSIFVFATLVIGVSYGQIAVRNLSIFPVLLLILLSERIVAIQLERKMGETLLIAGTSIVLGIIGFYLLSWKMLQNFIILYPETIFLLIPFNIIVGRYFGLRITEYFRFKDV